MKKLLNILMVLLIPVIFAIQHYILLTYNHPIDKYFLLSATFIMFVVGLYTGVIAKFFIFLKTIKVELSRIFWISNDKGLVKLGKILALIVVAGFIIALMDKGISIFITKTLLSIN
jgi:preprotein translocase subunit SecE